MHPANALPLPLLAPAARQGAQLLVSPHPTPTNATSRDCFPKNAAPPRRNWAGPGALRSLFSTREPRGAGADLGLSVPGPTHQSKGRLKRALVKQWRLERLCGHPGERTSGGKQKWRAINTLASRRAFQLSAAKHLLARIHTRSAYESLHR